MKPASFLSTLASLSAGLGISTAVAATTIEVSFSGTGPTGFAPLFSAFHDGSYDTFDAGSAASANLETLAEVGNPAGLIGDAMAAGADTGAVTNGGGPFPPGSSASAVFVVSDGNNLFNYAAMLLPTNDWFVGNGNAIDVSALLNAPAGTSMTISIGTVWDAGTEFEDFAFSAGNPLVGIPAGDAANGAAQGGVVTMVAGADPFSVFASIPQGFDTTTLDFTGAEVASITLTVVPEPSISFLGVLALSGFILQRHRRRPSQA